MVTSDDHGGIKVAVGRYFQGASWQRCQFHFMRNVLSLASKCERKALVCFYFPPTYRNKIRNSNILEWLNGESRKRTRVVRIFHNEAPALRLITVLAMEQSEEWETSHRRYMDIDKLEDWGIEKG